jgi:hypothetical protein
LSDSGSVSTIALVRDDSAAVMATPASASLTGLSPERPTLPSTYTPTLATSAPAKANQI